MKLPYGKLVACLSGSAFALLPVTNAVAEDRSCPAGSCRTPSALFEEFERRFGNLGSVGDRALPDAEAEPKTYLGVRLQALSPELAEAFGVKDKTGALVVDVLPKSPAEDAGLKQGDVITAIDGKEIADPAALQKTIAAHEGGAKVEIHYLRGDEKKSVQAELAGPGSDKSSTAATNDRGTLGVSVADLSDQLREQHKLPDNVQGVIVTGIEADSPAARAGLRVGDVIQQIDRKDVDNARGAAALSKTLQGKDKVIVLVWSNGASRFTVLEQNA